MKIIFKLISLINHKIIKISSISSEAGFKMDGKAKKMIGIIKICE